MKWSDYVYPLPRHEWSEVWGLLNACGMGPNTSGRSALDRALDFIRDLHARANAAPKADLLLAKFVEAVCEHYADDLTAPSIIVSKLDESPPNVGHKPGFYASVARYHNKMGRGREVVAKVHGHETPEAAVRALGDAWLVATRAKKSARSELAETLSAK